MCMHIGDRILNNNQMILWIPWHISNDLVAALDVCKDDNIEIMWTYYQYF